VAYACDCCARPIVERKLKGIGYICDACLPAWAWTGYERTPPPAPHYPACPYAARAPETQNAPPAR
jgi:ribosomal protein L37AE/L43A